VSAKYLADTSAFQRLIFNRKVREEWEEHLDRGLISICTPTEIEIFFSARSKGHRSSMEHELRRLFPWSTTPQQVFEMAYEIQQELTNRGTQRSANLADLLTAATALRQKITVLHYDWDFLTVADVTGQKVHWVAEPGSVS
jgi:predicted nucleic acid-binding protein